MINSKQAVNYIFLKMRFSVLDYVIYFTSHFSKFRILKVFHHLKYQDIFKVSFAYLKTEIKFYAVSFARRALMYELEVREGSFSIKHSVGICRNKNRLTGQLKSKHHHHKKKREPLHNEKKPLKIKKAGKKNTKERVKKKDVCLPALPLF